MAIFVNFKLDENILPSFLNLCLHLSATQFRLGRVKLTSQLEPTMSLN